jgi:hypothetical protein
MLTCKSPRKVMRFAYELARRCLPPYSGKFSRKDYTLAQLFACLVVREHQKKSYRGIEALLRDSEHWCRQIGMKRVPDHNTLFRAFHFLLGRWEPRVRSTRRCTILITARDTTSSAAVITALITTTRQTRDDRARPVARPS